MSAVLKSRWAVLGGFAIAAVLLFVVAPALLSPFRLDLLGKYLCYAMVAVGIGLAWGRGGMLTLGQGVFFGIGAYLMAMHLKLADAGPGGTPDFMALISSDGVPLWWEPFRSGIVTVLAILVLPALVAGLLGLATFRRRVRGAYFAILSQALAAAFAILLIGNPTATGGSTGLNNFRGFFGFNLYDPLNKQMLFFIASGSSRSPRSVTPATTPRTSSPSPTGSRRSRRGSRERRSCRSSASSRRTTSGSSPPSVS